MICQSLLMFCSSVKITVIFRSLLLLLHERLFKTNISLPKFLYIVSQLIYGGENVNPPYEVYKFSAGITYLFKVNNSNTRTRCDLCSKLAIKTPNVIDIFLISLLLLTSNIFQILFPAGWILFCNMSQEMSSKENSLAVVLI